MKCNARFKCLMLAVNVVKECMKVVEMQQEMYQMDLCNFFEYNNERYIFRVINNSGNV